ncbi:MAG: dTDP-4-dehydrorhamnose 3,5-epimerase [Chloroflexi bacterium]|jgi:dTDP-4-dehydrorhamnose 3,5-epimerase|nr:dTDP-4-dehydrorhamnose 3,5-epimerase [Chloroflexota bacterium]HOE34326.1 dTDP-4-dehydrorhamnose 3,5-epimerase [Anaerolineaceae bacterium]HOT25607.1 dTDP-4-dehydrorhamnose 3,5-epimerase [Anaerolineaceae bacterium]HQH57241.1 dTDP-4-dehydrorhamnose 3,5-epimerase [Anaerolineaceae bacterium]HQK02992.1 dTDP-4-dehydrorhamnose 3,5-epimerase [Anaerolineaceae bacterium]
MRFEPTSIPDVKLFIPQVHGDQRGFFAETFRQDVFEAACGTYRFVQDNHSGSRRGILRGLHYQIRHTQGKLVRAVAGEIYDVAVDLRQGSPNFGRWVGMLLSAQDKYQLWIPPGFAHGFYVLSDWAEVFYKATDYYAPQWERGLRWDDPALGIAWPLPEGTAPLLSAKDENNPCLREAETFPAGWNIETPREE